jgi:hypothetical protein
VNEGTQATEKASPPLEAEAWSPGDVSDEGLGERLGQKMMELARQVARRGASVEIVRSGSGQPPVAMLPACTVRFLVPRDLAYAKCDCTRRTDCEHVAVAVWAFRKADETDRQAGRLVVSVHFGDGVEHETGPIEAALDVVCSVFLDGVSGYHGALAQRFAIAREMLESAGYTWPQVAMVDLEESLEAYRARSSRYRAGTILELGAELLARGRAVRGGHLPPRHVLGLGEALETKLDQLKLVGLGARVDGGERDREAEVYFADPDSGSVLVYRKDWNFKAGETVLDGAALGSKRVMTGTSIGSLARGLVVTRVARRRANRSLVFGEIRGGMMSVTPQKGDWGSFPEPLLVRKLSRLEEAFRERPPRVLRPRVLAENVHVLAVSKVRCIGFSPGDQQFEAVVTDAEGQECLLVKPFRSAAPKGVDHVAAALSGASEPVRFISGIFRLSHAGLVVEPLGVAGGKLWVPDFEAGEPELPRTEGIAGLEPRSLVEEVVLQAWGLLEETVQLGLRHVPDSFTQRLRDMAQRLETVGLAECGGLVSHLAEGLRGIRAVDTGNDRGVANAFLEIALRLTLVREHV